MRARLASLVLSFLVLSVGLVRAESIVVIVNGEPAKHPSVEIALEPLLKARGLEVKLGTDDKVVKQKITDCVVLATPTCLEVALARLSVDFTLFVNLDVNREGGREEITVTGWLYGEGGKLIAAQVQVCRDCRNDTLGPTAEDMAKALFVVQSQGLGKLTFSSRPAGAKVFLDGELVGQTPWEQGVREGEHEAAFELPGHRRETRKVVVRRDEVTAVDVVLTPMTGPGGGKVRRNPLWLGVAIGGAAVAIGGGVVLAMDEDDTLTPTSDQYFTDTAPIGLAMIGVGAAAAVAGTYLYLTTGRPNAARSTPTAWVAPGGGGVGWAGAF
jgi:hypothetical protein